MASVTTGAAASNVAAAAGISMVAGASNGDVTGASKVTGCSNEAGDPKSDVDSDGAGELNGDDVVATSSGVAAVS